MHLPTPIWEPHLQSTSLTTSNEMVESMIDAASYLVGQIAMQALTEDVAVGLWDWKDVSESVTARRCVVATG